jgi:hypothetical protein
MVRGPYLWVRDVRLQAEYSARVSQGQEQSLFWECLVGFVHAAKKTGVLIQGESRVARLLIIVFLVLVSCMSVKQVSTRLQRVADSCRLCELNHFAWSCSEYV